MACDDRGYGGPTNDPFSESPQLHQKYIRNHLIPYKRDLETQLYEPYTKKKKKKFFSF